MGCCVGAEHNNWCEDYDIVYIDAEGKEYCIFHAPADCKFNGKYNERLGGAKPALMDAEQFNRLVFDRIDGVIEAGEDEERDEFDIARAIEGGWNPRCNFTGTIFPHAISFSKYNEQNDKYLPPINFKSSLFREGASFKNIQFLRNANFEEMTFEKQSDFNNALFKINTCFRGSIFKEATFFIETKFYGNADFRNTHYAESNFSNCTFFKGVEFNYSEFKKTIHFKNVTINHQAIFNYAVFLGNAIFIDTNFNCKTYFIGTTFSNSKNKPAFIRSSFNDYANFEQTKFSGGVNFKLAFFNEWSYFRNAELSKETTFAGTISKETILMESTDLSNLRFAETNIESFKFINCKWGEERFAPIYDEEYQENTNCTDTTLAEIYRRLKRIARESADEEQTSHWHYREKEMTRKSLSCIPLAPVLRMLILAISALCLTGWILKNTHPSLLNVGIYFSVLIITVFIIFYYKKKISDINKVASKLYLNTYKLISGYGEDPIQAGTILFSLVSLPIIIQFILSLTPLGNKEWLTIALWYMPLIKIEIYNSQGYHYLLKGISVTLITLQAALFGFALRNKLRR